MDKNKALAGGISKRQIIGIVGAVIILAGMFLVPVTEAFTETARNTLGVLLTVVLLLVYIAILYVILISAPIYVYLLIANKC